MKLVRCKQCNEVISVISTFEEAVIEGKFYDGKTKETCGRSGEYCRECYIKLKKTDFCDNEHCRKMKDNKCLFFCQEGEPNMKEIETNEEVSPQEKSSSNPGGEKVHSGARKCPECGSHQYVKRQSESEGVPAVICHSCGYKFSSAPAVEVKESKKPIVTKPELETEEIPSEITFNEVLKNLKTVKGITTVQETDEKQRVRIKAGNFLLFILMHRGKDKKALTVKGRNEEGKYHNYRIEETKDMKHWYDYAEKEALKIEA